MGVWHPEVPTAYAARNHTSLGRIASLFWNTYSGAVTIPVQTTEKEDPDVHVGTVPTMEHLALF